jgi:carbon-monoxide dehydrogenase medium subunit
MIPGQFEYVRPAGLEDALRILSEREGEAKVLSGGYSLLPLLKLRLAQPELLVDIRDVAGLDTIVASDTGLRIGGRVSHRQIHEDPAVRAGYPLLTDAAGGIGDPQVRNWGTIGGSCAHADPAADWPAVLLAARATITCQSSAGRRTVAAADFFLDTFVTAIQPDELLVEIAIPRWPAGSSGAYAKLERRAGDFSTVGAAAMVQLGSEGTIVDAALGLTAVADTPFASAGAAAALIGARPDEATLAAAGAAAAAEASPARDAHGPVDYKRAMVAEMTVRALRRAIERALAH